MQETNISSPQPPEPRSQWQKLLTLPLKARLIISAGILVIVIGIAAVLAVILNKNTAPEQQLVQQPSTPSESSKPSPADKETAQDGQKKEEKKEGKPSTPSVPPGSRSAPPASGGGSSPPPANPPTTPPPSPPTSGFPNASNTGVPAGTPLTAYAGPNTNNSSNIVLENMNFSSGSSYLFNGSNVTIRNSQFARSVQFNGDNITFENNTVSGGVSLSGTTSVTLRYNNISNFGADGIHLTSDSGQAGNVTITHNFIHSPNPGCGAHADGIQVRGVNGLTLSHNTFDMGAWRQVCGLDALNAAVFLETANGGNSNMTVAGNYLNGGGIVLRLTPGPNQTITNNAFGVGHYGLVDNASNPGNIVDKSGNYRLSDSSPVLF